MTFRRSTEDIDLGFGRYAYDSEHHNRPKVQIIAPKQPPPEDRVHYCSTCNGKLQWLEQNRKFICYKCSVTYSETDTPLASILNSIKPLQSTD